MEKILIPGIDEKIEKILRGLELKTEVSPENFLKIHKTGKHRYSTEALSPEGERVAFYARLHDNLDAKEKFTREIVFLERIRKSNFPIKKVIPKIINWGIEKDFEWLVREYPTAPPLGQSRNLTQKPFPGMVRKITKLVLEISDISPKTVRGLRKFNCQNYLSKNLYKGLVDKKILTKDLTQNILEIIKKSIPLAQKENHYFCHGDLNLGNILADKKEIWLIDWELIQLNNFSYDIGYLWAHLWEAKKEFRRSLVESFIKKLPPERLWKFKKLLPLVVSYLSLGGIELKKEDEKKELFKKRRNFYINLLKNCTKGFNQLIKV